ncbi:MAG: aminoacyl-tRNA hydrolase [Bacteroidales bacterium]
MKYLIVGLGNTGDEYKNTRHNIGFMALDAAAAASNVFFTDKRYGAIAEMKIKGRSFVLLKPSTFMNLSGYAVDYWMKKEKIPVENILVIVDDLALPEGSIRMRSKGGAGGHNGLTHINEILGTDNYARIRIGIGNNFSKGAQRDYVLGEWTAEEQKMLKERLAIVAEMIKSFGLSGTELTMTAFNKAGKNIPAGEKNKQEPGKN